MTLRLAPQHPFLFMHATGAAWAHFSREAWDEAIPHAETAALRRPNCFAPLVVLTAAHGLRGDIGAAQRAGETIRRLVPHFSKSWLAGFLHIRPAKTFERACEGLREAGIG